MADTERRDIVGGHVGQRVSTMTTTQMSANEREQQRIAYNDKVDALTRTVNYLLGANTDRAQEIVNVANYHTEAINDHSRRLDATERQVAAFANASLWARLRWMVRWR